MKVKIDGETCVGCGLCVEVCPEVFDMDDGLARVIVDDVPDEVDDSCRDAVRDCPVEAIELIVGEE